jgi:hypothetical protein
LVPVIRLEYKVKTDSVGTDRQRYCLNIWAAIVT